MLNFDHVAVVQFGDNHQNIDLLTQRKAPPQIIVFVCCFEWEWYSTQGFRECAQYAQQHHSRLIVVTGSAFPATPNEHSCSEAFLPCVEVYSYPLYWLVSTFGCFLNTPWTTQIDHVGQVLPTSLYVCLNNKPHHFRCAQMDMLAKHDLIELGKISWDTLRDFDGRTHHDTVEAYNWQHWEPDQMMLETFPKHFTDQRYGWNGLLPECYRDCAIHLVTEATINTVFLTEKIVPPLMTGKFFVAMAAPGFHAFLRDQLGFQLYEELFDYSFDSVEDVELRADLISENISRFRGYTPHNWAETYRLLADKVTHNHLRLRELYENSGDWMPEIVRQLCQQQHPEITGSELYGHFTNSL